MIKAIIFDFYGVLNDGMNPNDRLIDFIKNQLKPKYKIALLSNAADEFMYEIVPKKLADDLFDEIFVSYKLGVAKPDPEIYKIALTKLEVKPEEVIFVDDLPKHLATARDMGIKTILYQDFEQMKSEIDKLLLAVSDN